MSPKLAKIPSTKEDKLVLQRSINSEIYNERNSTDDDFKGPILSKSEFKNIMDTKPFDK